MQPPDVSNVLCDQCKEAIKANEEAAKMAETLKQRLTRKGKATKPSWEVGDKRPLVEGTPLEKKVAKQ